MLSQLPIALPSSLESTRVWSYVLVFALGYSVANLHSLYISSGSRPPAAPSAPTSDSGETEGQQHVNKKTSPSHGEGEQVETEDNPGVADESEAEKTRDASFDVSPEETRHHQEPTKEVTTTTTGLEVEEQQEPEQTLPSEWANDEDWGQSIQLDPKQDSEEPENPWEIFDQPSNGFNDHPKSSWGTSGGGWGNDTMHHKQSEWKERPNPRPIEMERKGSGGRSASTPGNRREHVIVPTQIRSKKLQNGLGPVHASERSGYGNVSRSKSAAGGGAAELCPHCVRPFPGGNALERHIRELHSSGPPVQIGSGTGLASSCDVCFTDFPSSSELRKHKTTEHSWSYLCTTHLERFKDAQQALTHYRTVHHGNDLTFDNIEAFLGINKPQEIQSTTDTATPKSSKGVAAAIMKSGAGDSAPEAARSDVEPATTPLESVNGEATAPAESNPSHHTQIRKNGTTIRVADELGGPNLNSSTSSSSDEGIDASLITPEDSTDDDEAAMVSTASDLKGLRQSKWTLDPDQGRQVPDDETMSEAYESASIFSEYPQFNGLTPDELQRAEFTASNKWCEARVSTPNSSTRNTYESNRLQRTLPLPTSGDARRQSDRGRDSAENGRLTINARPYRGDDQWQNYVSPRWSKPMLEDLGSGIAAQLPSFGLPAKGDQFHPFGPPVSATTQSQSQDVAAAATNGAVPANGLEPRQSSGTSTSTASVVGQSPETTTRPVADTLALGRVTQISQAQSRAGAPAPATIRDCNHKRNLDGPNRHHHHQSRNGSNPALTPSAGQIRTLMDIAKTQSTTRSAQSRPGTKPSTRARSQRPLKPRTGALQPVFDDAGWETVSVQQSGRSKGGKVPSGDSWGTSSSYGGSSNWGEESAAEVGGEDPYGGW